MAAIIAADSWMSLLGSAFEALKLQIHISLQSERSLKGFIEASSPISKTQLLTCNHTENTQSYSKTWAGWWVGGEEEGCEGLLAGG